MLSVRKTCVDQLPYPAVARRSADLQDGPALATLEISPLFPYGQHLFQPHDWTIPWSVL